MIREKEANWKSLLEAIETFVSRRKTNERLADIIHHGLNVFANIEDLKFVSLFLLNQDSYEFEHKTTVPGNFTEEAGEYYNYLLENGSIGQATESAAVAMFPPYSDNYIDAVSIVVPLGASKSLLGIVLLALEKPINDIDQILIRLCSLHGSLFASSLENSMLFISLKNSQSILEQKVAARTLDLAQSKRELKTIFDSVPTGILVIDAYSNRIVKVNPEAEELIQDEEDNIIGRNIENFFDKFESAIKNEGNKVKKLESILIRPDGSKIPILRTFVKIMLGRNYFRIESFLDITDRKKAEKDLKESNEVLELKVKERTVDLQLLIHKLKEEIREREKAEKEAFRMLEKEKELGELKTKFITMVSHEFRTPLTVIKSAAQMVERFRSRLSIEDQSVYHEKIISTVDSMVDLIENVLFIGKNENRKIINEPKELCLKDFCDNLVQEFKLSTENQRTLNLNYEYSKNNYKFDEKLLRMVLNNLLTNAVKYSKENDPVDLNVTENDNEIVFSVKDYGIGIPQEQQDKIFDIFYRADNVGNVSGTGLGMAVVVQSLEMMNGTIELESEIGKGSIFKVTIPV